MTTPSAASRSEPDRLAAAVLERLAPHLPALAAGEPTEPATADLYHQVAERLRALGEQQTLAELAREPHNNSLARRLLATAATEDPGYAAKLTAALAALPAAPAKDTANPGDTARTDGSTQTDGPPAPDGRPSVASAAVVAGRRPGRRGILIGVGIAVCVVLVGCLVGRAMLDDLNDAGGLTSDSTCAQYRRAPAEDRVAAIRQIGLAKGVSGTDHPLVMSAVDQLCESQPDQRLGDVLARFDD
ncbi:hypothetical protein O7627_06365 [Solwaraspora sp. WMMD1047]|uniref:hypothetical protein n=1 Tax=Solwaraspora sp. WMMD1047 TaxID=3016102 RepID=UPI002415F7BB|nr:hypothetical protein [Solwaraspora sp. WMMD1047]MDG4828930.1 hypothetical protein [Solwaraspora sp. WMMD1047]